MKKQLRFLYRYLIASRRWRRAFNRQNVLIALVFTAFLLALFGQIPAPVVEGQNAAPAVQPAAPAQEDTPVPQPTVTRTPFPPEFYTNADQTIGITVAGAVLVLIILIGVLKFQPTRLWG